MKKEGASQVLSFVILIGLGVTLSIIVGLWIRDQARESSDIIEESMNTEMLCSEVFLTGDANCKDDGGEWKIDSINLTNRGKFNIIGFKCGSDDLEDTKSELSDEILIIGETEEDLNICKDVKLTRIMPYIKVKEKEVLCADRGIKLEC